MPAPNNCPPNVLFAVGSLVQGGGGIAELSRQVLRILLEMQDRELILLDLHVLEDSGPADGDELFANVVGPGTSWYAGSRARFALGVGRSRAHLQLFDHVGLARLNALSPLRRGPLVLLIHGVEMWRMRRADYLRTAQRADLLIANSGYTAEKTRECCPGLPPIKVCWPGKDPLAGSDLSGGPGMSGIGPHAMLIVGRLDSSQRHKGHDHLLGALPAVLERVPDAQLVIAGGGDDRNRLEQKARELGIASQVLFAGRLDETVLHSLYDQCALFVMPSDGDGFGLVFLEAMMHRLPCVGLSGSSAEEIFEDGKSGILVDRADRAGMANHLACLLKDDERRSNVGAAGHRRYLERFTGRHYAERLRPILEECLG